MGSQALSAWLRWAVAAGLVLSLVLGVTAAPAEAEEGVCIRVEEAISAFKAKDPDIETFFKNAYGYAVFDNLKIAFGISGGGGSGVAEMRESAILGILGVATLGFYIDSAFEDIRYDRALCLIAVAAVLAAVMSTTSSASCSSATRRRSSPSRA